jgi:transposase InsO family protein
MPKARPERRIDESLLARTEQYPQLELVFSDAVQERYEVARPLLLGQPITAKERVAQTHKHPQTVRRYVRRFEGQGMLGLFDEEPEMVPRCGNVSEAVRLEVLRLKTLYGPLNLREIANIVYGTLGARIDHKTVGRILERHLIAHQPRLPLPKFRDYKEPYEARVEVVKLYYRGWNIQSISGFLGVSRQHIYTLLERFEEEHFAGLVTRPLGPRHHHRKMYLPLLKKVSDLQREHPLIGRFRLWDWLLPDDKAQVSERTVGRAMAFNRFMHEELNRQTPKAPKPHPFKARTWHQYWFIDHRYLEKIDGVQYYLLCILEGYSRAFLSGIVLATQARGPVLKLLYETVLKWGAPGTIVSDSGGAFASADYEACCERLGIRVEHIEARQSWQNMIEIHFNIQRLIGDPHFARGLDEAGLAQTHAWFIERYNSSTHSAHQKRKDGRRTPGEVLSWVRGEPMSQRQVQRGFRELLWTRTLDRAGYALVQNYYLYGERAANRQRVCL